MAEYIIESINESNVESIESEEDSGTSEVLSEDFSVAKRKGRGKAKEYDEIKRFDTLKSAITALEDKFEGHYWSKNGQKENGYDDKYYYACKSNRQCPKNLYIQKCGDKQDVIIWLCTSEHEHKPISKGKLPQATTDHIKSLIKIGCENHKLIKRSLKSNGLPELKDSQLYNLKSRIKTQEIGKPSMNLHELKDWCNQRMKVPNDDDVVFCAGMDYQLNENNEFDYLRVIVTTKRLLSLTKYNQHICTDGTYKLNYNGFPLLIVGTTDHAKKFHPFAAMLTKTERADDYEFMFKSVKTLSFQILKIRYEPVILVADCAEAITKGFSKVFNLEKRIYCWAHVIRAIDGQLKTIKEKTIRASIRQDVIDFNHYATETDFVVVMRLMISKWKHKYTTNDEVKCFINYFNSQWASPKRLGWIDHYSDFTPVTNNGIESYNRYIKQNSTFNKRAGLNQFLHELEHGFIYEWSLDRKVDGNANVKHFNVEPMISLADYTTACQWLSLKKDFKKYKIDNKLYYCTPSSDKEIKLSATRCYDYFQKQIGSNYRDYDDYINHSSKQIHYVEINDDNWKLSKCSCSYWCKNYTCKHSLAICHLLNKFEFPKEALNVPIGRNRKRGAPKKTTSALKRQPNEEQFVLSDTESESDVPLTAVKTKKKRKVVSSSEDSDSDFDIFDEAKVIKALNNKPTNSSDKPTKSSDISTKSSDKPTKSSDISTKSSDKSIKSFKLTEPSAKKQKQDLVVDSKKSPRLSRKIKK